VDEPLPVNARRVRDAAAARGLEIEVRSYPEGTRTAADAASAVGCHVGQIVKSLVFTVPGEGGPLPVLALVSGSNQLDERRLAVVAGASTATRADAGTVRQATGFPIGGVAPFGLATALPIFIDETVLHWDVVWAAAGTPHHVFPVRSADLVRATAGVVAALRRSPQG
jgi:prolyl-tRNA editing enzyme YbaK/EbsC (Cys-tRNA(Pro) deacylase)